MECTSDMPAELLSLVADVFRALGSPLRLRILQALLDGPRTVGQLVAQTNGRQADVSKHLRILTHADLVRRTRRGTSMVYRAAHPSADRLCSFADKFSGSIFPEESSGAKHQRETAWIH